MDRKMNPRETESMKILNPRAHHNYKKSEECIFKDLKLCVTSKTDRAYSLRPLMDRKMNPREPESMKISNPRGHHIYKKSE